MRVLKTAAVLLGLLLAGTALTSTVQAKHRTSVSWADRISVADPIPQCLQRRCPPTTYLK
jgi:hypothetical protein